LLKILQIGQIPILDLFYLKNPIYLLLSKYGLLDSTFAVAKFAQARMTERFPPSSKSSPTTTGFRRLGNHGDIVV
jgi:hypothetical protein